MSELSEIIRREIAAKGVISFARFMELALYCPRLGYYERPSKQIGCQGDFYTSVAVGSVFGELLACQFTRWLAELSSPETVAACGSLSYSGANSTLVEEPCSRPLQIVEAGAHDGQLAFDILTWITRFEPGWLEKLEYWILEVSPERQAWQQAKLTRFAPRVRWFQSWESGGARAVHGIIFSNELLDALPVHRIGWDGKLLHWFEWGVGWDGGEFIWKRMPIERGIKETDGTAFALPQLPQELLTVLPDGFITEVAPAAQLWWRQAARALDRGKLLTLDYGLCADDFVVPERANGTLRAYCGHHSSRELLACPGDQDLTAHVNFTALQTAGESEGLVTENVMSQTQFLTRVLERATSQNAKADELDLSTTEKRRQFQTLTHPEHLGRPLKVLVQSRA